MRSDFARMRFTASWVWFVLVVSTAASAAQPLGEWEAVGYALEHSPDLLEAKARVESAQAQFSQTSTLLRTNPEASVAAGPRWGSGLPKTGLDLEVAVDQRVEIFGQQGLRQRSAERLLEAARADLEAARNGLVAEVRTAWGHALAARSQVAAAERADKLAQEALDAATQRFESGATNRLELNAARTEAATARRQLSIAQSALASAQAALRLRLGLPSSNSLQLDPAALDQVADAEQAETPLDAEALIREALAGRPELRAAQLRLEAAASAVTLADRDALPSPAFGAAYRHEADEQVVVGQLAIPLPVFDRNQAQRGQARAEQTLAQRGLEALQRQVRLEVQTALEQYRAAISAAQMTRGEALQAAEENLQLATEAYQAGKIDFLQLLVVRRAALEERRAAIEAAEDLHHARAQLDRVLGRTK